MSQTIPLLWLPGLLCNNQLFQPVNQHLKGVEPVCAELTAQNSMQELARTILEQAPESFILGGLSMGGILAFEVYRQAPKRVKGLILLDTNSADEFALPEVTAKRNLLVDKAINGQFSSITPDSLMPVLIHIDRLKDTELTQTICQMAENIGVERFVNHAQALASRPDARPLLGDIVVPTVVICGREDALCPVTNHLLILEKIPNASLHVLPNCGHLSTLEKPTEVAGLINGWLKNQF
ncbi:alpha/beta hydrolase [Vibrio profundum]|uniref:alpha/beta fold hydrolase n=1 Tax=Vibrio profundum TaxID=2910247 RepID=UPI003D0EB667